MSANGKRLWFDQTFRRAPPSPAQADYEMALQQALPRIQRALLVLQGKPKAELATSLAQVQKLYKERRFKEAQALLGSLHEDLADADTDTGASQPSSKPDASTTQTDVGTSGSQPSAEDAAHAGRLRAELELLIGHAREHVLGKPSELDKLFQAVQGQLGSNLKAAAARLDELRELVNTRDLLKDAWLEFAEDARAWMQKYKVQITAFDDAIKSMVDFLAKGDFASAEGQYKDARKAFSGMADLPRLEQVRDRLKEEAESRGVEQKRLSGLLEQAGTCLDKRDQKGAQAAIDKIRAAIAELDSALEPEQREKLEHDKLARRLESRLKRVQAWAQAEDAHPDIAGYAKELAAASAPPLDAAKQARAAELYAKAAALSGQGRFDRLPGSANDVYVLATRDRVGKTDKSKQFFKPASKETANVPGFPKGGGAVREVLGKVAADKLAAMTGLPIHVAETSLVELPPEVLPEGLAKDGPAIGSMQRNIHHKGDAPQRSLKDMTATQREATLATLPKRKVQAKQVFDLAFLNLDVHPGNVYVKGEGDEAEIDGIDNGMGLPSEQGLLLRAEAFGSHALGKAPSNDEPMDASVVEAVQHIDEEALEQALRESMADMKARFPDEAVTGDKLLNDEHIRLMKASVSFLKQAVGKLTMNQIQQAYLVHMQDILGLDKADPRTSQEKAEAVIASVLAQGEALKECVANMPAVIKAAKTGGWMVSAPQGQRGTNLIESTLIRFYPAKYLAISKDPSRTGPLTTAQPLPKGTNEELDAAYQKEGGDARVQRLGGALSAHMLFQMRNGRLRLLRELELIADHMSRLKEST